MTWKGFFAFLALCDGNPSITGGIPSHRASNTGFYVFFEVIPIKLLNKYLIVMSLIWDAMTLIWRHCNVDLHQAWWCHGVTLYAVSSPKIDDLTQWTKWLILCRRHLPMILLIRIIISVPFSSNCVIVGAIFSKSALAWRDSRCRWAASSVTWINTLRPRQNGRHFPEDIFKWICLLLSLLLRVQLTISQHWFR